MSISTEAPRWRILLMIVMTLAVASAFVAIAPKADASSPSETYRITVENLTHGQPLTPAVVAVHGHGFRLFRNNRSASNGIQQLAENGGVPVLVAELEANPAVASTVVVGSAPIAPGGSESALVTTSHGADRISLAAMLVCTNDGFGGLSSVKLSGSSGSKIRYAYAYDAGTEINTQDVDDLVPPCDGDMTTGTGVSNPSLAEHGRVRHHRGIQRNVGDLTPEQHGWRGPVMRVTIQRVATYEITIQNLTGSQPITPAVVAVHQGRHELFRRGRAASNGIQQLAENGGVPILAAEVAANMDVAASTVVGTGPIAPGGSATGSLEVLGSATRLSLAAMLVCTNDGFGGIDGKRLPRWIGESSTVYARSYDAGTELNTELISDLVPPCDGDLTTGSGESNPALFEGGVVRRHGGITGAGDLEVSYGWSDPVIRVTITRIG